MKIKVLASIATIAVIGATVQSIETPLVAQPMAPVLPVLTIGASAVQLASSPVVSSSSEAFRGALNLTSFDYVDLEVSTSTDLTGLMSFFSRTNGTPVGDAGALAVFLFVGSSFESDLVVTPADIDGAVVVWNLAGTIVYEHFVSNRGGGLVEDVRFSTVLEGELVFEHLTVAHFSSGRAWPLKTESSIYGIKVIDADTSPMDFLDEVPERSIFAAYAQSTDMWNGSLAGGLTDSRAFYAQVTPGEVAPVKCGFPEFCKTGTGTCSLFKNRCIKKEPICMAGRLEDELYQLALGSSALIQFEKIWEFRDDVLMGSPKGRNYVQSYYTVSADYEWSIADAPHLVAILPDFVDSIEVILNGAGNEVVLMERGMKSCFHSKSTWQSPRGSQS